jgi:hypothetical protein
MRTFAHGRVLLVAACLVGGCGSNTGLVTSDAGGPSGMAGATGSDRGTTGGSSMAAAGAASPAAAGATPGIAGADGGVNDTIPSGWAGAQPLMIVQSQCIGGGAVAPTLAVVQLGAEIEVILRRVEFREFQSLCGYSLDNGTTTRVLVQPCDLHPTNVPAGDCTYDVVFTLPSRADRIRIEAFRRFDDYGAPPPNAPVLLATAELGTADGGQDSAGGGAD